MEGSLVSLLAHQDVTHSFDVLVGVVWEVTCFVSTRVGIIRIPSCTKPDFGVTRIAARLLVTTQLISESYNNSHNRVKTTPLGGVTIFGVNITPKRSYFFL